MSFSDFLSVIEDTATGTRVSGLYKDHAEVRGPNTVIATASAEPQID